MVRIAPRLALSFFSVLVAGCGSSCPAAEPDHWSDCRDDPTSQGCGIVLPVTIGMVPLDEVISCTGFDTDDPGDPCTWFPGAVGPVFHDGVFVYRFMSDVGRGFRFQLEVEITGADVGRARFCRVEYNDVSSAAVCPVSNWTCASAGTVVLSAVPNAEPGNPRTIDGEIHAQFPGGETVDAIF